MFYSIPLEPANARPHLTPPDKASVRATTRAELCQTCRPPLSPNFADRKAAISTSGQIMTSGPMEAIHQNRTSIFPDRTSFTGILRHLVISRQSPHQSFLESLM